MHARSYLNCETVWSGFGGIVRLLFRNWMFEEKPRDRLKPELKLFSPAVLYMLLYLQPSGRNYGSYRDIRTERWIVSFQPPSLNSFFMRNKTFLLVVVLKPKFSFHKILNFLQAKTTKLLLLRRLDMWVQT